MCLGLKLQATSFRHYFRFSFECCITLCHQASFSPGLPASRVSSLVRCMSASVRRVSVTVRCVSVTVRCMSVTVRCVSVTVRCVSVTVRYVSVTVRCVSVTVHRVSVTVHRASAPFVSITARHILPAVSGCCFTLVLPAPNSL